MRRYNGSFVEGAQIREGWILLAGHPHSRQGCARHNLLLCTWRKQRAGCTVIQRSGQTDVTEEELIVSLQFVVSTQPWCSGLHMQHGTFPVTRIQSTQHQCHISLQNSSLFTEQPTFRYAGCRNIQCSFRAECTKASLLLIF